VSVVTTGKPRGYLASSFNSFHDLVIFRQKTLFCR